MCYTEKNITHSALPRKDLFMKRRRKTSVLRRLLITLLLFLGVMGVLIAVAILQPTEANPPPDLSGDTDTESTETSSTEDPVQTVDKETVQALAATLFAQQEFTAKHMAVYDTKTGAILYEKNAADRITAASTIKLLTALTMLDYVTEDTVFTVGNEIKLIGSGSSTAKLKKGFTLTVEQALDALLIPSGNDAAYMIAAHVGRKLAKDPEINDKDAVTLFLDKMNDKAESLGVTDSLFTCPDGYPNKTQYTTASDMMKIAVAAAKNETIRRTTSKTFVTYTMNDGTVLEYTNTNQLIVPSSSNFYEGLFGLKTGTTNAAGQCLIAGCDIYGHEVIITIFKSTDRWSDCKKVIDTATAAISQAIAVQQ